MAQRSIRRAVLCVLLLGGLAAPLQAGGPKVFEHRTRADLAKGTFTGTRLTSSGEVRRGPSLRATDLAAPTAWHAIEHGGATWVATGNRAEVLRVDGEGAIQRIATGDEGLMVTALAPLPEGAIAAAIAPGGRIVRIDAAGKVEAHAETGAEYVWQLHADARGSLLAACGTPGQLVAMDPFGSIDRTVSVPDVHARCLLVEPERVTIGTSPKGLVLETVGEQGIRILHDFAAHEIVALHRLESGALLLGTNADAAGGNAQTLMNLVRQATKPNATQVGQAAPPRASLQTGGLAHLDARGVATTLWTGSKVALRTLRADGRTVWLGTEPGARVLRLDVEDAQPGQEPAQVADLEAAEVSSFLDLADGALALVTSNPAQLVLTDARGNAPAHWTSEVLDATSPAAWGAVHVAAHGVVRLEVRSGTTEKPDATWSDWRGAEPGKPLGIRAQRVQLRVHLEGAAILRGVTALAQTPNRAPSLSGLALAAVKQAQGVPQATPSRDITWTMKDPDGDALTCTVTATRLGSTRAVALIEDVVLTAGKTTWDTAGWPDGDYALEVTVHDGASNPAALTTRASKRLGPVRVDNTAPTVRVTLEKGRIVVVAQDARGGRIHSARIAVDGAAWRQLLPTDGVADQASERFELVLDSDAQVDVVVQVRDAWGNVGAGAFVGN